MFQDSELWDPPTGTRYQYAKYGGVPSDVYERTMLKLRKLMGSANEDTMPSGYLAREDYVSVFWPRKTNQCLECILGKRIASACCGPQYINKRLEHMRGKKMTPM